MSNLKLQKELEYLKNTAKRAIDGGKYNQALALIEVCASILYEYNQDYTDDELENLLVRIEKNLFAHCHKNKKQNKEVVLFYDGFGLDTRGLALIFLKALAKNGYCVVYVTMDIAKDNQPSIMSVLEGYNVIYKYIKKQGKYVDKINQLTSVFEEYLPSSSFFYTTPFDVASAVVFNFYRGNTIRYQIDLTDHAFWLGKNAFDYCVELRNVGASISLYYRDIPRKKLVLLPYYANIDESIPFEGFPFDTKDKRIIFSGGALYKTLGDKEKKYYKIVEYILNKHFDIIFLYAGTGDDSELLKLKAKYPDRVYHIAERKDLLQIMKRCVIYLNTYPMFGGLMMNYAASAGKLPITLRHNNDADGLLFDQDKIQIEYDDMKDLLLDVDKLLTDEDYLKERELKLRNSVITEEEFQYNVKKLIDTNSTQYEIKTDYIDTTDFRKEYLDRFDLNDTLVNSIATYNNFELFWVMPFKFIKCIIIKLWKKILGEKK